MANFEAAMIEVLCVRLRYSHQTLLIYELLKPTLRVCFKNSYAIRYLFYSKPVKPVNRKSDKKTLVLEQLIL